MNKVYFFLLIVLFIFGCRESNHKNQIRGSVTTTEPTGVENVAYKWGQMALTATANDTEKFRPRPTVTSRYLALIFVSVFDAWLRYDDKAIPVYLTEVERIPSNEHTLENKEMAGISRVLGGYHIQAGM